MIKVICIKLSFHSSIPIAHANACSSQPASSGRPFKLNISPSRLYSRGEQVQPLPREPLLCSASDRRSPANRTAKGRQANPSTPGCPLPQQEQVEHQSLARDFLPPLRSHACGHNSSLRAFPASSPGHSSRSSLTRRSFLSSAGD